jgi:WD40 repeat protein
LGVVQVAVISGGEDGTVRVWDLESEPHATLRIEFQHRVVSVAYAND